MIRSLHSAASGMEAQQLHIDVIANNLANVNTTGFKRSRAHFEDLLYQAEQTTQSVQNPDADTLEAGARLAARPVVGPGGAGLG